MTLGSILDGWRAVRHGLLVGVLAASLGLAAAACGGQARATEADEKANGSGWVELDDDISVDGLDLGGSAGEPVEPQQMSLAEAGAALPFAVALPAWVPAGFALQDQVEVVAPEQPVVGDYASLIVTWENPDGAGVHLQVSTTTAGQPQVGAAGLGQAVAVNGQTATLQETQGLGPDRLSLAWTRGALNYRLTATGGVLAGEHLIQMAESIP